MHAARNNVLLPICALLLIVGGCDRKAGPTAANTPPIKKLPTTQMTLAGKAFVIEVAVDPADQERGLMYRTSMGPNEGMIFVFPKALQQSFWMKNTLIPLDIAYLDDNGTVLNVPKMYPHDLTSVPSRGPMRYAIELNQGTADRIGLHEGDHIEVPASLR